PAQQAVATTAVSAAAPAPAAALPSAPADAAAAAAPAAAAPAGVPGTLAEQAGMEIEGSAGRDAARPATQTERAAVPHAAQRSGGAAVSRLPPTAVRRSASVQARSVRTRDVSQPTHRRGTDR